MYKLIISILGTKGGASKTTTAHLLSLGLAHYGARVILLTTDHGAGRLSLNDQNRPYKTRSGQTSEDLKKWFTIFQNLDITERAGVLIVDGGGNRQNVDDVLSQYSNLNVLPFKDSEEDLRVVREDMTRIPNAFGLPSVWPTNTFAKAAASKIKTKMEKEFPNRILKPVPSCRATQQLLKENYTGCDSTVISIAKNLAFDVLSKVAINPFS